MPKYSFLLRSFLSVLQRIVMNGFSLNSIKDVPVVIEYEGKIIPINEIEVDDSNNSIQRIILRHSNNPEDD